MSKFINPQGKASSIVKIALFRPDSSSQNNNYLQFVVKKIIVCLVKKNYYLCYRVVTKYFIFAGIKRMCYAYYWYSRWFRLG